MFTVIHLYQKGFRYNLFNNREIDMKVIIELEGYYDNYETYSNIQTFQTYNKNNKNYVHPREVNYI